MIELAFSPRVALYRLFHAIWSSAQVGSDELSPGEAGPAARLPTRSRQFLLLTTIEEFSLDDAAAIMNIDREDAKILAADAQRELEALTKARVMIIEDEPIIALDLESIVGGMGHTVTGIADTHASAVELAAETKPDLILADIQLADGSSGIDAVSEILTRYEVPVIFITAFPERLLSGERPEPTYLVTKPFRSETVEAAIAQALFHAAA